MSLLLLAASEQAPFNVATGGSVSDVVVGGITYRLHQFTGVGTSTFTVYKYVRPFWVMCLGGGGGGGTFGEGRGAGVQGTLTENASLAMPVGSYTVTVGAGGARAANGETSSLHTVSGGGGGAGAHSEPGAYSSIRGTSEQWGGSGGAADLTSGAVAGGAVGGGTGANTGATPGSYYGAGGGNGVAVALGGAGGYQGIVIVRYQIAA